MRAPSFFCIVLFFLFATAGISFSQEDVGRSIKADTLVSPPSVRKWRDIEFALVKKKEALVAVIDSELPLTTADRVKAVRRLSADRAELVSLAERMDRVIVELRVDLERLPAEIESLESSLLNFLEGYASVDAKHKDRLDTITAYIKSADELNKQRPSGSATEPQKTEFQVKVQEFAQEINADRRVPVSFLDEELPSLELSNIQERLAEALEDSKETNETDAQTVKSLEKRIPESRLARDLIEQNFLNTDETRADLQALTSKFDEYAASLLGIELDKSDYTSTVTIAFTILVGGVILGFYVLAFNNQDVQVQIFSGDRGIQFITLFSLVIAIILFGILGILESRELSALLGGLSGYILGRGTQGARGDEAKPTSNGMGAAPSSALQSNPAVSTTTGVPVTS